MTVNWHVWTVNLSAIKTFRLVQKTEKRQHPLRNGTVLNNNGIYCISLCHFITIIVTHTMSTTFVQPLRLLLLLFSLQQLGIVCLDVQVFTTIDAWNKRRGFCLCLSLLSYCNHNRVHRLRSIGGFGFSAQHVNLHCDCHDGEAGIYIYANLDFVVKKNRVKRDRDDHDGNENGEIVTITTPTILIVIIFRRRKRRATRNIRVTAS